MKSIVIAVAVLILAGCSSVETIIDHSAATAVHTETRTVTVKSSGAWPFYGQNDVRTKALQALRRSCRDIMTLAEFIGVVRRLAAEARDLEAAADILPGAKAFEAQAAAVAQVAQELSAAVQNSEDKEKSTPVLPKPSSVLEVLGAAKGVVGTAEGLIAMIPVSRFEWSGTCHEAQPIVSD